MTYIEEKMRDFRNTLNLGEHEYQWIEAALVEAREAGAKAERDRILAEVNKLLEAGHDGSDYERAWNLAAKSIRDIIQSPPTSQSEGV